MVNLAVFLFIILAIPILHYYHKRVRNWQSELLSTVLCALGMVHLMAVPVLAYFLLGEYEYRMWILQGPLPFKLLGSGPRLLWLGVYLVLTGYGFMALSLKTRLCMISRAEKKAE